VSRRVYDGDAVVAEWDDDTRTYRRWDKGALVEERPYDVAEAAALVEAGRCAARESARDSLLGKVDAAIAADLAYLDSADLGDRPVGTGRGTSHPPDPADRGATADRRRPPRRHIRNVTDPMMEVPDGVA